MTRRIQDDESEAARDFHAMFHAHAPWRGLQKFWGLFHGAQIMSRIHGPKARTNQYASGTLSSSSVCSETFNINVQRVTASPCTCRAVVTKSINGERPMRRGEVSHPLPPMGASIVINFVQSSQCCRDLTPGTGCSYNFGTQCDVESGLPKMICNAYRPTMVTDEF